MIRASTRTVDVDLIIVLLYAEIFYLAFLALFLFLEDGDGDFLFVPARFAAVC
jgi:hypothetical protein